MVMIYTLGYINELLVGVKQVIRIAECNCRFDNVLGLLATKLFKGEWFDIRDNN